MPLEPGKIRNVAVVGHRGTGKTSLVEALLFQAGATNRLGTVESGSTVSDWDDDEQRRQMSLSASICNVEWQGRKINLVDIPASVRAEVEQYRERLLDAVVETDESLMERYLDGQELSPEEVAKALKDGVTRGELFPVAASV